MIPSKNHRTCLLLCILFIISLMLSACSKPTPASTSTELPSATATSDPTETPTETVTPLPTEIPFYLPATSYSQDPMLPIIMYHRFKPDYGVGDPLIFTQLGDFQKQLQRLYDNGFSLVSLEDWIRGDLTVPDGRRPVAISMDDLFFADQIYLDQDGNPSPKSGLGLLWKFSQEHPDFGFAAAISYNMGDKLYGNIDLGDRFIVSDDDSWKDALSRAIAWCVEHNAMPYNHLYLHPLLTKTAPADIQYQLRENEVVFQQFLERAGKGDLADDMANIIALPFGLWPESEAGQQLIRNYKTSDGRPVLGVLEANGYFTAEFLPAPYTPEFNRFHIPRFAATNYQVGQLVNMNGDLPYGIACQIGPMDETRIDDLVYLQQKILDTVAQGGCQPGIISVMGKTFRVKDDIIENLTPEPLP